MADVLNRPGSSLNLQPGRNGIHPSSPCTSQLAATTGGLRSLPVSLPVSRLSSFLPLGGRGVLFHLERGRCARRVRRPSISGRRAPSCVHFVKLQDTWAGSRRSTIRRAHLRWGLVGRRPFEVIPRLRRGLTIRGPLRLVSGFGWGLTCSALPLCLATRLCRGLACARWSLFVNLAGCVMRV